MIQPGTRVRLGVEYVMFGNDGVPKGATGVVKSTWPNNKDSVVVDWDQPYKKTYDWHCYTTELVPLILKEEELYY